MNIAKQLEALHAKRKALIASLETLVKSCEDESRLFNADEQKNFDAHKAEVASIDEQTKRLEEMQRMVASSATPVDDNAGTPGVPTMQTPAKSILVKPREKGQVFVRYAMSLIASKGNLMQAAEMAKKWRDTTPEVESILKSAVASGTSTDTDWAASLAPYQIAQQEFVELLRPETIIGQMTGFRRVPFNITIPRQTAGSTAGWVGEGKPKPMSELAFDNFSIPHAKIAVIVAFTEELARFASPSAEATISQDLRASVALYMDQQFTDPTVTASSGIRPASITNGATSNNSAGTSLDHVTTDLTTAMGAMTTANVPLRNRYWILNPRTELFLMTLRNTNGFYAFRDEMVNNRTILGVKYVTSNAIAVTSGDTHMILVEASEIYMADDGETLLDVTREASLQFDTAPSDGAQSLVSLWQNNMVGVRAERYVYWLRRRSAAVQVVSAVGY
jgi:HK97 family phage major capsid protein